MTTIQAVARPETSEQSTCYRHRGVETQVTCANCGKPMYQNNPRDQCRYFICSTSQRAQGCSRNSIKTSLIEAVVYSKLRGVLLGGSMERLTASIQLVLDRRPKPIDNSKQIAKLDGQIERAASRFRSA